MHAPNYMPVPGSVVGRKYRIQQKLGAGGMGSVYLAVDETLGRHVAIKVLDPSLANDPETLQRFEREARVTRVLQHPNTIQIFDYGRSEMGLPYIVMEFVRGEPLDEIIAREGAMTVDRVIHLGRQVLSSLAEAHNNGVIHRDLKPQNVMVGEFAGRSDFVKVLDFGIAKLLDSHRDSGALKTRTGLIIGSPGYMAPERIKAAELTPSSDLYSLAIMFAEMLKGRPLYEDMTPVEILANNLGGRPLPIPPEVRASALGGIIDQATQYEPNMRFQTAADMMAALDRAAAMAEGGGEDLAFAMEPTAHMVLPAGALDRKNLKRAGGGQGGQRASLWSNPINIILAVLILVLVVATVVILLVN